MGSKWMESTRDRKGVGGGGMLLCFCSNSISCQRPALLSPCVASVCCFGEGAVNKQLV